MPMMVKKGRVFMYMSNHLIMILNTVHIVPLIGLLDAHTVRIQACNLSLSCIATSQVCTPWNDSTTFTSTKLEHALS